MKIAKIYLILFSIILYSCSSDNENQNLDQTTQDPIITGFTINFKSEFSENDLIIESYFNGTIENNRVQKTTGEQIFNGSSQGIFDNNLYVYDSNNRLLRYFTNVNYNDDGHEFFYDDSGKLKAMNKRFNDGSVIYTRFFHPEQNISIFERLSLPYNDPETSVDRRFILEFDENNNIIKAGKDHDHDNIMDFENIFEYDDNNNLINIHPFNEDSFTYSYTDIINTKGYLDDNSFGKKVIRLISAELFGNNHLSSFNFEEYSYNLTNQEITESDYEVLENNFYNKKIEIIDNDNSIKTYITEYFFD